MMENNMVSNENVTKKRERVNYVRISGVFADELTYSHITMGEKYYRTKVKVVRQSGVADNIPVIISELVMPYGKIKGKYVEIEGSFRSTYRYGDDGNRHLKVYVFPSYINVCESPSQMKFEMDTNEIYLKGTVGDVPIFKTTSKGRHVTEFLLRIPKGPEKVNVIPCIAWGKNAFEVARIGIGAEFAFQGRIQSRKYTKRLSQDPYGLEERETYEVSLFTMELGEH